MAKLFQLYRHEDLATASTVEVMVTEQEADAMRSLDFVATAISTDPEALRRTNWSILADKDVRVWVTSDDNDVRYAELVYLHLRKIRRQPASFKVIAVGDLQKGKGIEVFISARRVAGDTDDQIRRELEGLADLAQERDLQQVMTTARRYEPFPVAVLPEPIQGFVRQAAKSIGCDTCFVALPLLTACASAIGYTRVLRIKQGWDEPPILWTGVVGESGSQKTPAFKVAMKALRDVQSEAFKTHENNAATFARDKARYDAELVKWKRKPEGDPPQEPVEPTPARCIVSDTTVEALAPILAANPRGVLLARDELSGWINSFDRYAGGKGGADAANWLSMFNGQSLTVDRKTGPQRIIHVEQAAVWVCGGIQPEVLRRALGKENLENGLAARILLAIPPRKPKRWTETGIDPAAEARVALLVERLRELKPNQFSDTTEPIPVMMTPKAKKLWIQFYNEHSKEQIDLTGTLSMAWSKLECYAARLALVVHFIRWAAKDPTLADPACVDEVSIAAGIKLSRWFGNEARRVYAMLSETPDGRDRRRLVEFIERKGGRVTVRDVQRGCRWIEKAEVAEAELYNLAKAGYGVWRDVPSTPAGGRSTRMFCLHISVDVDTAALKLGKNLGSVDVDAVDIPIKYHAREVDGG